MQSTFSIGRIAGVPIGLNWTWLLIFALVNWTLASSVFPSTNPGLAGGTYAVMGFVATLAYFGSLLLHELGHALRARREGVTIDGITLWIFGGVAQFRGFFPSAAAELRIALAGPVVTAVLAAAFVALAGVSHFGPAVDGVCAWLGYMNGVLLAFNLVPALPLDGGRVLRAGLWWLKHDLDWATVIAAGVSRALSIGMIGLGIFAFFAGGGIAGLWLAAIGWFVLSSVSTEARLRRTSPSHS
jgi:Zn-dependent protease